MKKLSALIAIILLALLWHSVRVNPETVRTVKGSASFYDRNGILFHVRLSPKSEWQIPIPLNDMGKWLPVVAVNAEDGRFYRHMGIDVLSLMRAILQDITRGEIVSGASTITSQLIRMKVSETEGRKRTFSTKVREFIMAVKIERFMNKDEILECYLNTAPFGGNIRGVEAASLIYFGKKASQISPGEACMLIGMLKGPALFRPDKYPLKALKRRNEIISLMERKKVFDTNTAKRARLEELPRRKFRLPSRAYHFTELVLSRNPEHKERFDTTLDLEIQTKLEGLVRGTLEGVPENMTYSAGITDTVTGSLIAWLGNARFSYGDNWVDCGISARSPGSTLKPFAYLLGVEQGIISPQGMIQDTPYSFLGRAPRNFDLMYRGKVSIRTALAESLNVPAVRVMRRAGSERLLTLLREFGFHHITNTSEHYGDALILGGCEVTLLEELEAYTALSNGGVHRKLKVLSEDNQVPDIIASESGCWIIGDILKRGNFALKTGTSYGFRDAWACAWNKDYAVGVWCGNGAGNSWDGLIGAQVSAPLAEEIMIRILKAAGMPQRPENVKRRKVCEISGLPPVALCPSTKTEWYIEGVTHTTPCGLHGAKAVTAEEVSGFRILSPVDGAKYYSALYDGLCRIPLKAEGYTGKVAWYVDGEYIGMSVKGNVMHCDIHEGEHLISASDEKGHTSRVKIELYTPAKSLSNTNLF